MPRDVFHPRLANSDKIARTVIGTPDHPVHLVIDLERLDRDLVYATAMRNTVMAIIATRCPATMEMSYPLPQAHTAKGASGHAVAKPHI